MLQIGDFTTENDNKPKDQCPCLLYDKRAELNLRFASSRDILSYNGLEAFEVIKIAKYVKPSEAA